MVVKTPTVVLAVACAVIAACGSAATPPATKNTSASTSVKCSASKGPLTGMVGPSETLSDAGDDECGPGGKCTYITEPFPGPQPACPDASVTKDDSGAFEITCPPQNFTPEWVCVYASGYASSGDGGD